jgi:hypothetical protein
MSRILPVVVVLPMLLAYGVAEGVWSDRWNLSHELDQAPKRLASLPQTIGPWQGEDVEMNPRIVRQAELRGHLLRHYTQPRTGESVTVLVVCGRPGPVAVHTPQVCYGGSGYTPAAARKRYHSEDDETAARPEFWSERYQKVGTAIPAQLQIYYAWNTGHGWVAVDNARLQFASGRALYKIYVVRELPNIDEPADKDPVPAFLDLLMPELDRCLFAAP